MHNLTVCTFNIRYGTAPDGDNSWPLRRAAVATTLRAAAAAIIGLQECQAHQRADLQAALPGYAWFGVGRDDGRDGGEMCAVLIDPQRLAVVDGGHFWLSATPDVAGSRSWGNDLPRMATWVRLRVLDDTASAWPRLLVINTHLDHASAAARHAAIDMLRAFIARHAADAPLLLGDFNAPRPSAEMTRLLADGVLTLVPTEGGTFHDFTGGADGLAIDWIAHDGRLRCHAARVVRTAIDGRWPSDHHPLLAVLGPA